MNILRKDNHYYLEFQIAPETDVSLAFLYTPDYFEQLGFFANMTIYPPGLEQMGGGPDTFIEEYTYPFNYFASMANVVSKGLSVFDIRKLIQRRRAQTEAANPDPPSPPLVAEPVEHFKEDPSLMKVVLELTPFNADERIIDESIRFVDFVTNRVADRDERIHNDLGLTYNELLHWLDMLRIQREYRVKKGVVFDYSEQDLYVLDGRLIVLKSLERISKEEIPESSITTPSPEMEAEKVKSMIKKEQNMLHLVVLEGTKSIGDLHH
jgi:hypothetical protein